MDECSKSSKAFQHCFPSKNGTNKALFKLFFILEHFQTFRYLNTGF